MPQILIVIILFAVIELLSYFYQKLFIGFSPLRAFLFLGVFIHEFSHYLACKITLAPVHQFKVGRLGGHVQHGRSRIPLLGGMLISLAPLIVGIVLLIFLLFWVGQTSLKDFWQSFSAGELSSASLLFAYAKNLISNVSIISWQFWLWLFLSLNILAVFAPSKQDLKNIAFGLVIFILISYFLPVMVGVNSLIIFALSFALVMLVAALILLVVAKMLKRIFV